MTDKNVAIINYLLTCDSIKDSSIYFNFINAKNDTKQIIAESSDVAINRQYLDGSILKKYQCVLVVFKSMSTKPIVKVEGYEDENVADVDAVQKIIDWIAEQNDLQNFPDFGETCIVESIQTTSDNPNLDGIDDTTTPALARYSITIQIEYLDTAKVIWNKEE